MKTFIVLALVACACAAPGVVLYNSPLAVARTVIAAPIAVPAVTSSQYHAQDELGQYSYGYAGGPSAKAEAKTFDGVTRGMLSFSFYERITGLVTLIKAINFIFLRLISHLFSRWILLH
ncbi:unnamed protein product [Orchesella dallaii]|uniref:Uncharacterized protein n=1 Tax=Orchesella dallaii TaxID=48710 RepID=A0ABP1QQA3_9HEXA